MSKGLEAIFLRARSAERRGDSAGARSLYESILSQFPGNARARQGLEKIARQTPPASLETLIADYQQGRFTEVVKAGEALRITAGASAVLDLLIGAGYASLHRYPEAESAFRRALATEPGNAELYFNLGVVLQEQGQTDAALQAYGDAVALQPDHAAALFNVATALASAGRNDDAIAAYRKATIRAPQHLLAHYNLGNMLREQGRIDEALAAYDNALAITPDHAPSLNNRGVALEQCNRIDEAIACHQRALLIDPENAEAWNNLGNALRKTGRLDEAIAAYGRAIDCRPHFGEAHNNLGNVYRDQGELVKAVAAYDRALAAMPDAAAIFAQKLHHQAQMCEWTAFTSFEAVAKDLGVTTASTPPFTLLAFEDDPERQLSRSRRWSQEQHPPTMPLADARLSPGGKIRIGYFSADFHDHATLILMAGLFRTHDRDRFAIHAYSYGEMNSGAMREQLIAQVDGFTDVRAMSDKEIAAVARGDGLDIAVDLKGYTTSNRVALFAHRPAPVQISFLGYPGSLGVGFMDYMVADAVVVPVGEEHHYDEKLIRLPYSYQPNDDQRTIAATTTRRSDHGLPQEGFVFCCFNNAYKIGPPEFAIWMRLLAAVPGSIIWLLRSNRFVEENLRRAARSHGIDDDRIIFADRMPPAEHLARHRHADLFLDSFRYNAHTTASDALWAGLPMVTYAGRQFSARVGASLLTAAGLPELVTESTEAYERLALDLATSPERLAAIKAKLGNQRRDLPLFDSARFTRHMEAAYMAAIDRYTAGREPDHITITP